MILTQRDSPFIVSYFKQGNTFFRQCSTSQCIWQ